MFTNQNKLWLNKMKDKNRKAMFAKKKDRSVNSIPSGTYKNSKGDNYVVLKDGTMYLYDYFLMNNIEIDCNDLGKNVGTVVKPRWKPMNRTKMINYCDSDDKKTCKTSVGRGITLYHNPKSKKMTIMCQAHAMNTNLTKVNQDGTIIKRE